MDTPPSHSLMPSTPRQQYSAGSTSYLPEQVFSSPLDSKLYPASTMAAVEATRARFFSRNSDTSIKRSTARRPPPPRKSVTSHLLSSSNSGSYRQSFIDRCQQAMDQTRSNARSERIDAFRKGQSEFTRGFFSDEAMDVEDDQDQQLASSPPDSRDEAQTEEDEELMRRTIIAEYSRLKRIYELKGHLEIGWMHPDQIAWLEEEIQLHHHHHHRPSSPNQDPTCFVDPLYNADDQELEQLYIESLQPHEPEMDWTHPYYGFNDADPSFEEALANLPI